MRTLGLLIAALVGLGAQEAWLVPNLLPPIATMQLARSLDAARGRAHHLWRDTPALNGDGTVNAYVEIAQGDRRKWEFDMRAHARAIDRVVPSAIGGFPVNYGFVPQTVSYDGDPLDALVLGPPKSGGMMVRGVIVGVMFMDDEKGHDSKVVISETGAAGGPAHALTAGARARIGGFFDHYKQYEPHGHSNVAGWGSSEVGREYVLATHAFFAACRAQAGRPCRRP